MTLDELGAELRAAGVRYVLNPAKGPREIKLVPPEKVTQSILAGAREHKAALQCILLADSAVRELKALRLGDNRTLLYRQAVDEMKAAEASYDTAFQARDVDACAAALDRWKVAARRAAKEAA